MDRGSIVAPALALICGAGFGLGCPSGGVSTTFRCDPSGAEPRCPADYLCCSDDPAAVDLDGLAGALPAYEGREGGSGVPLFSGLNNSASYRGLCIREGAVPPQGALPEGPSAGCPVPCNPTWAAEEITEICGVGALCCQTVELEPEDCVLDPGLGDEGCWRPVHGGDIQGLGGADLTVWAPQAHGTAQDPGGSRCRAFVEGVDPELFTDGLTEDALLRACYRQLGVADQRGLCIGGAGVNACPLAQPGYRDACEQRNDADGRTGCG